MLWRLIVKPLSGSKQKFEIKKFILQMKVDIYWLLNEDT